jgi:hypothetical protein
LSLGYDATALAKIEALISSLHHCLPASRNVVAHQESFSSDPVVIDIDLDEEGIEVKTDPSPGIFVQVSSPLDLRDLWLRYSCQKQLPSMPSATTDNSPLSLEVAEEISQGIREELRRWLADWVQRRQQSQSNDKRSRGTSKRNKRRDYSDSEDEISDSDGESQASSEESLCVLQGPAGSGKTALVYEAARLAGVQVIELNASQARSNTVVKRLVSEVAASHRMALDDDVVQLNTSTNAMGTNVSSSGCSAVLFDEADIVMEEEDQHFHAAIQRLAQTAKCPLLLTVEQLPPFLYTLKTPFKLLQLHQPNVPQACAALVACSQNRQASFMISKAQATLSALLCLASDCDLRAARQSLALRYAADQLPPSAHIPLALDQWMLGHNIDFAIFDSLPSSFVAVSDRSTSTYQCISPRLHGVHPHTVRAGQKDLLVSGSHFLQRDIGSASSLCKAYIMLDGQYQLPARLLPDEELRFTLPADLSPGFHSLRVLLNTTLPDSPRTLTLTSISEVYFLLLEASGGRDSWQKMIFSLGRAYAAVRSNLLLNVSHPKSVAEKNKKKRAGYASSKLCKGQLALERKRFKEVKQRATRGDGGNSNSDNDSDDGSDSDSSENDEEGDEESEEEERSEEEVSGVRRRSKRHRRALTSDSEQDETDDQEGGERVEIDDLDDSDAVDELKEDAEEVMQHEGESYSNQDKSGGDEAPSNIPQVSEAEQLDLLRSMLADTERTRQVSNLDITIALPASDTINSQNNVDLSLLEQRSQCLQLLSDADTWASAFVLHSGLEGADELMVSAASLRSQSQYSTFCRSLRAVYVNTFIPSDDNTSHHQGDRARKQKDTIIMNLLDDDDEEHMSSIVGNTQVDPVISSTAPEATRNLLNLCIDSPFLRQHYLHNIAHRLLQDCWNTVSGHTTPNPPVYVACEFFPLVSIIAELSLEADERYLIIQRENVGSAKRRRLMRGEDDSPIRYQYLKDRLGLEEQQLDKLRHSYCQLNVLR